MADVFTFLFTDIEGSTKRWELAPEAMRAAVAAHDEILERAITADGGRVFKKVGDAFCAVFRSPDEAVNAAIAAQTAIGTAQWPTPIEPLRIRIGIHCGTALAQADGDFAGPALNRVARLTAAGHGGQILLSEAAATLVRDSLPAGAALRTLGSHRLRDLSHHETLFQVEAPGLQTEFAKPKTLDTHPNNLPLQLSPFVGRAGELAQLAELVRSCRLLTIAGPGGIGKTRLSLQVAAQAAPFFEDGCWLVKLADVRDPQLVASTIASVLHVPEEPGRGLMETVVAYAGEKHLLLVLDNSEHLLRSVVEIAGRLLHECARVTMLVTSREPTHLAGETVHRVHPLPEADAEELFRQRAHASGGFDSSEESRTVAAICRQLDGIPLAIELAAARLQTLSARELESALQRGSDLLISKDPQQDARHRTLTATIAWSYELLAQEDRDLLEQLHVFEGGFTREAAQTVCDRNCIEAVFIDALDSLVDKSFVDPLPGRDVRRFRVLEPIRRFLAHVSARNAAQTAEAKNRHFEYYFSLSCGEFAALHERATRIDADTANVRAALSWGIERDDERCNVAEFAAHLSQYWQLRGTIAEARVWLERVLNVRSLTDAQRGLLLRRAATFATKDDDYAAARSLISESVQLYRSIDHTAGVAEATQALAVLEHYMGNVEEAYRLYGEALDGFAASRHPRGMIAALTNRAIIVAERGGLDEASDMFERAAATCRAENLLDDLASVLSHQGDLEIERKRPSHALRAFTEALAMKRRLQSLTEVPEILGNISYANLLLGETGVALDYARSAVREALNQGGKAALILALEVLAIVLFRTGHAEQARTALAASACLRRSIGYGFECLTWSPVLSEIKAIRNGETFEAVIERIPAADAERIAEEVLTAAVGEPA